MSEEKAVQLYGADGEIIETEPTPETGLVDMSMDNLKYLEQVAEGMDRFVVAHKKITNAILKLAKPGDWVIFEKEVDGGIDATACLSGSGAERIASSLGMSFKNWSSKKEEGKDEKGQYYYWWHKCTAIFGKREIEVEGRAGSRDKFFGKAYGAFKPLSEVDEGNVRIASRHNCFKEGVKLLLGIRNIPLDELKTAGIQFVYGRKVTFKKPAQEAVTATKPLPQAVVPKTEEKVQQKATSAVPEGIQKQFPGSKPVSAGVANAVGDEGQLRAELRDMLLELTFGEENKIFGLCEAYSSYTNKEGKMIKGRQTPEDLSGKWLSITHNKVRNDLNKKNGVD